MTVIQFYCDRCGGHVKGIHTEVATGGFYVVSEGGSWSKYGRDGEHFVCDECIQSMPEYRAVYGPD